MGRFEKFNRKKRTVNESINTEDMEFFQLRDYVGETIQVYGFFFTEGDYGKQVVFVTNDALINMPQRAVAEVEAMEEEPEVVEAIINGEMSIEVGDIIKSRKKGKHDTVAYTYVDTPKKSSKKAK